MKAETRDLATGALLHNVFLIPGEPIEDLDYLGRGRAYRRRPWPCWSGTTSLIASRYRVVLVDLLTGSKVDDWVFDFVELETARITGGGARP